MVAITILFVVIKLALVVQSQFIPADNHYNEFQRMYHEPGDGTRSWTDIDGTTNLVVSLGGNKTLTIRNIEKVLKEERKTIATRADPFDWTKYHTYDQIYEWLDTLLSTHSSILSNIDIGQSYEGRKIRAVKLSHKAGNPAVFIESNIHAREWVTSATATWILNALLTSTDESIQELAQNIDWYILPVLNVDGFVHTHEKNRMWRKTRKPASLFCVGADPNRNFNMEWRQYNGASDNPCDETFAGHFAESETEIAAFTKYYDTIASSVRLYISFHSYSQVLLTPFGHTHNLPENHYDIMDIGLKTTAAIKSRHGRTYEVGPIAEVMYTSSGSSVDWVYGRGGLKLAYSFEFRDARNGEYGFLLPADQIIPNSEEVLDGIKAMIVRARELNYL